METRFVGALALRARPSFQTNGRTESDGAGGLADETDPVRAEAGTERASVKNTLNCAVTLITFEISRLYSLSRKVESIN